MAADDSISTIEKTKTDRADAERNAQSATVVAPQAGSAADSEDAVFNTKAEAEKKAAADKKAKQDALLNAQGLSQAATLTAPGAKVQPVLDVETETPEKKQKVQLDEFPKFPATGDWVAQMLWLLDLLFFNSSVGRPPIIDKEAAKGFIQRLGEGFANLAADFKESFPNANRLMSGTVGAAIDMTANLVKGVGKVAVGAYELTKGAAVTAVGGLAATLVGIPKAIAAPKGQGGQAFRDSFDFVTEHGLKSVWQGGKRVLEGGGNIISVFPRAAVAARDGVAGVVGLGVSAVKAGAWVIDRGKGGPAAAWVESNINKGFKADVAGIEKRTAFLDRAVSFLSAQEKSSNAATTQATSQQVASQDNTLAAEAVKATKEADPSAAPAKKASVAPSLAIPLEATGETQTVQSKTTLDYLKDRQELAATSKSGSDDSLTQVPTLQDVTAAQKAYAEAPAPHLADPKASFDPTAAYVSHQASPAPPSAESLFSPTENHSTLSLKTPPLPPDSPVAAPISVIPDVASSASDALKAIGGLPQLLTSQAALKSLSDNANPDAAPAVQSPAGAHMTTQYETLSDNAPPLLSQCIQSKAEDLKQKEDNVQGNASAPSTAGPSPRRSSLG